MTRTDNLTLEEARELTLTALADPQQYLVKPGQGSPTSGAYGPLLSEFFSRFERVEHPASGLMVEDEAPYYSQHGRAMLLIGRGGEHTEVVAKLGSDRIQIWRTAPEPTLVAEHPTIYHLLASTAR